MPQELKKSIAQKIILEIITRGQFCEKALDKAKRRVAGKAKIPPPASSSLIVAYHELIKTQRITQHPDLEALLRRRKGRTASGIAIITNLTKPYPCPGKCTYCPTERKMPKSYLASEPAAARALRNKFDPYTQTTTRIQALQNNNHPTDKIELIIKGGTWNYYPRQYQNWFIKRCFEACNDYNNKKNKKVKNLAEAQKKNETAKNRIIGLTLETRPDYISPKEIIQFRKLGCTRVEIGAQIIDDEILQKVRRGHTEAQLADAMKLLRDAGFKTDLHIMPMLQGSTAKNDLKKYKLLFQDQRFRPDMVKIYPCAVIKKSLLERLYQQGKYRPYSQKTLFDLLLKIKEATPKYVRISRLIRDIPSTEISAGSNITNLRELLQAKMQEKGKQCQCLRYREIAHQIKRFPDQKLCDLNLFIQKYIASGGWEYFLTIEDKNRKAVFAFLRLRIPPADTQAPSFLPELTGAALIRELHTYGYLIKINQKNSGLAGTVQHTGMGKKLIKKAEQIAP